MRRSSPISTLHQLCGDPAEEWRRRFLYYSLGQSRDQDPEYMKLLGEKKARNRLRNYLTWHQLRIANISLGAKADCTVCGANNVLASHIVLHSEPRKKPLYETIIKLISTKDSLSNLAGLDKGILSDFWLFYKKSFKFKTRPKITI